LFLLLVGIYIFSFQKVYSQGSGTWTFEQGNQYWLQNSSIFDSTGCFSYKYYAINNTGNTFGCNYWKINQGNFWVFAGKTFNGGFPHYYNYLAEYSGILNAWAGKKTPTYRNPPYSFTAYQYPTSKYNVKGVASVCGTPSGREGALTWTDAQGDMWLYGGKDTTGLHSDMWKYNIALNMWMWVGGDSTPNHTATYGIMGTAALGNSPGGREGAITHWVDKQGNFWLFGGVINRHGDVANDLWKYNPTTDLWTWMHGSTTPNDLGNYGTLGVAAFSNLPPARNGYAASQDTAMNLLLFGGMNHNDVWKYNISANKWTWIAGSNQLNDAGSYVAYCQVGLPAARHHWRAAQLVGNFKHLTYLFGGTDTAGNTCNNDLWLFDSNTNQFKWLNGTYNNAANQNGNYGTAGVASPSNRIPGRYLHCMVVDYANRLYVYTGADCGAHPRNDVWRYIPDTSCIPLPPCSNTSYSQNISICKNDTFKLPNGYPQTVAGTYVDTIMNMTGCDSVITTHLSVLNYQYQTKSITICSNQNYTLHNGKKLNAAGVYYDTIPSATSCDSIYTIQLSVNNISNTSINKTICSNQSFLFNNQMLTTSGIYYDTLINQNGCDSIISLQLVVNSVNNINLNPVICSNQFYTLPNGLPINKSGIYKDTLLNMLGCDSFITINLSVIDLPQINLGNDTNLCAGNSIILSAPQYSLANYVWNNYSTNNAITVDTSGLYHVMITMPPCASVADSITINFMDCDCKVLFPNSFTPNNDGVDETFKPIIACDLEPQQYDFKIYNRLGQKVFSTTLFGNAWDGTFNGALQELGAYVFFVSFINPTTHQKEMYKGDVILLR
jgi:gliding motility-associated-like protein